ncbi:hypothetical protein ACFU93_43315 [Streptomyces sp. NPDC057611]
MDVQRETASREEILEFWTPERMKEAEDPETGVPVDCSGWGWFVRSYCW